MMDMGCSLSFPNIGLKPHTSSYCKDGHSWIAIPILVGPIFRFTIWDQKYVFQLDGIDIQNGYNVNSGDTVVFCFGEIDCLS